MSTYQPGTVAVATVRGMPNVRVVRVDYATTPEWMSFEQVCGPLWHSAEFVTDVRPLVVLDLAAANELVPVEEIARTAVATLRESPYISDSVLADQIEAQAKPPRIPEPTEPLAEVEASMHGRERRRLVRGLTRGGGGHDVRWVDGVSSWSWHELLDPVLVREGVES